MKLTREQAALSMIEDLALNGFCTNDLEYVSALLSDIYCLAHGVGTCHDECPVKRGAIAKIDEHIEERLKEPTQ